MLSCFRITWSKKMDGHAWNTFLLWSCSILRIGNTYATDSHKTMLSDRRSLSRWSGCEHYTNLCTFILPFLIKTLFIRVKENRKNDLPYFCEETCALSWSCTHLYKYFLQIHLFMVLLKLSAMFCFLHDVCTLDFFYISYIHLDVFLYSIIHLDVFIYFNYTFRVSSLKFWMCFIKF